MAGTLSLSSTVQVFPCPSCKETINTSMLECPFCSTHIDHAAADVSAAATSRISQACSDASYLKVMAWSWLTFIVVMFIPLVGLAGFVGLLFLRVAIPVMVVRWWIKFGSIKTDDRDFARAKRAAIVVSVIAALLVIDSAIKIARLV
jgi:hypothetical protein